MNDLTSRWWRCRRRRPRAPVRLVCLPHAGGTAGFFASWSDDVGGDVEVVAAQYPGREERISEPIPERMDELVTALHRSLRPLLDRPIVLFGHSMGAVVAHELARRLDPVEGRLHSLVLSAMAAPGHRRSIDLHHRGDDDVVSAIERLGGATAALRASAELRALALPVIRADFALVEGQHHPTGPSLTCPVVAVIGDDDEWVHSEEAAAWSTETTGPFRLEVLRGGHFAVDGPEGRRVVAAELEAALHETRASGRPDGPP